jgi:hypothetical protein
VEFAESTRLAQPYRFIYFLLILFSFFGFYSNSCAQDSTDVSSVEVIRGLLKSIADEAVTRIKLNPQVRVALRVEGDGPRSLVENTFIEALQGQNYISILNVQSGEGQVLSVYLLGITLSAKQLDLKLFKRSCQTKLEVRTIVGADRKAQFIGTFHRESLDTVHTYPSLQFLSQQGENEDSVMQRIMTPFILIGGAVLVVYLFFTVRS